MQSFQTTSNPCVGHAQRVWMGLGFRVEGGRGREEEERGTVNDSTRRLFLDGVDLMCGSEVPRDLKIRAL